MPTRNDIEDDAGFQRLAEDVARATVLPFRRIAKQQAEDLRRKSHDRYLARLRRVHLRKGFQAICGVELSSFVVSKNSPAFPDGITCKKCLRKMHV